MDHLPYFHIFLIYITYGYPTKTFAPSHGIRWGNPLSQLLFRLIVEGSDWSIKSMIWENSMKGIRLDGKVASHLQFIDDTLLFGILSLHEVEEINSILE